jgi:hypothetical protein
VRTTVGILDQIYRRLKGRAAREDRSVKGLILRGVEHILADQPRTVGRRVTLPLVRSKHPGTVALDNARVYEVISYP